MTFDCYVLSIGRKYFWARMSDQYDGKILISAVTKRDRNVFAPGAIFTARSYRGRPVLRFSHRRYTKAEIERVKREAARLATHFASDAAGK